MAWCKLMSSLSGHNQLHCLTCTDSQVNFQGFSKGLTTLVLLQGNGIIANCDNSSFIYLDVCDSLLHNTDVVSSPTPTPTPTAAPAANPTPAAAPTVAATPAATAALTLAVTQPATAVHGVATDR